MPLERRFDIVLAEAMDRLSVLCEQIKLVAGHETTYTEHGFLRPDLT
jgi:hypothetical protein